MNIDPMIKNLILNSSFKVNEVIVTGSRYRENFSSESDYDYVVVLKDGENIEGAHRFFSSLSDYSRFPLDIIVTNNTILSNLTPFHAYSATLNHLSVSGSYSIKTLSHSFDKILGYLSSTKILAKNISLPHFKSLHHLKKTLSLFRVSQLGVEEVEADYDKNYLELPYGHLVQTYPKDYPELRNQIIADLSERIHKLELDDALWEKYPYPSYGIDPIFHNAASTSRSPKEIYCKTLLDLIKKSKNF